MIQKIKSRINCVDYAQRIGLPIHKSGDRCISPLRPESDNKTSFVVYDDYYYDFGSYTGGDVIDFCANYAHNGDKSAAIHELADITGTDSKSYGNWKNNTQNLCNLIQKWHESLRPQDLDYLHSRRINDDTIKRLKIGYTGNGIVHENNPHYGKHRIAIPYWKNGYIVSWNARATELEQSPKYLKRPNDVFSDSSAVWGLHTLDRESPFLVIAEGAFDALSFEQENYPVLATMGGSFSKTQLKTVLAIAKNYDYVLLTFDADSAGDNFTFKLAEYLFKNKIKFRIAMLPSPFKDVSEYYAAGFELSSLISSAKDGLIAMCERITNKDEFKNFAMHSARFIAKPELADLFIAAKQTLTDVSADWLAELRKQCFSAPSEDYIAKLVVSGHNLKYFSGLGFYEYLKGYWKRLDDETVQKYISDELGSYRKGSLITNIIKLIKADCISEEVFNQKPVFNFINGTLHLDTMEFTDHNPADLCSFKVDYAYNPEAHSSEWEKFISDIADGDVKRIDLLQEISGYVLYSSNDFQTCAILLGEGSNGKSVYINMLTKVFGEDQVSNVEMASLTNDFQKILLKDSLLNVATETNSDVRGTESVFKQIVAGDYISGCYKNKDFVKFKPRCKMIFACNEIPKVNDSSFGFARRMMLVKFVNRFVKDPDPNNPHQFLRDDDLTERLSKQLPAIFNWCLEGYKNLHIFKEFTVTDDAEQLMRDFKETTSPISIFISDYPIQGNITNERLYEQYKQWCYDNGYSNVKSRPSFIRAFKQSMPDEYEEYRTINSNRQTIRGFRIKQSFS